MPVFKIFHSSDENDGTGVYVDRGLNGMVCITAVNNYLDPINGGSQSGFLELDDVPAFCEELRRVADTLKQGGSNG